MRTLAMLNNGAATTSYMAEQLSSIPPATVSLLESLLSPIISKVNLTGGNRSGLTGYRSNRSGPVPVPAGTQPAKIQILNLNLKNKKFPKNF